MSADTLFLDVHPPHALIRLSGEIDLADRADLETALARLTRETVDLVDVSLGTISYIDGACLRVIDRARRRLVAAGVRVEIIDRSAYVVRICDRAGYAELGLAG